jgi:uncharacterized membrane protein
MNRRSPARPAADRNADIVLGAAVIAMGLLAGLFHAFDVAAMPALTAADDGTLVDAMQQKIDKIESPAAWNIVRTLASTAAFGCLAWALVLRGRMGRTGQPQRPMLLKSDH